MAAFIQQTTMLSWQTQQKASPQAHPCAARIHASTYVAAAASQRRWERLQRRESVTCSARSASGQEASPPSSRGSLHRDDAAQHVQRRGVLAAGVLLPILSGAAEGPGALAAEPKGFRKLDSGVLVADIFEGGGTSGAAGAGGAGPVSASASRSDKVAGEGSVVAIQFTGRLAAKQGWVFDSTREPGTSAGEGEPFVFTVGDPTVIRGLSEAVKGLRVGGVRRAVIPPPLGYQREGDRPVPREFWQRRRLYSTVFNPTRIGNGEGDTLGTLVFDIELVQIR